MVGKYGEVLVMDRGLAKVPREQEKTSARISRVTDSADSGLTMWEAAFRTTSATLARAIIAGRAKHPDD
jgi:hypothetical protein